MTERIHGGDLLKVQKKLGFKEGALIDYSANINPLGPPARVINAVKETLSEIVHYPDPECQDLKDALSNNYPVKNSEVIIGNGSSELIFLLMKVLNPGKVLIPAPTFIEYQFAAQSVNSKVDFIKLPHEDDFELPIKEAIKKLSAVDLLFLCNPNNPTGTLWEREKIEEIIDAAQKLGKFIILDEAFMEFIEEEKNYSLLFGKHSPNNIFILRSMTKFFAIPGLRLGWGAGSPGLIKKLELAKDPWNVNILAQAAGREALKDKSYVRRSKEIIKKEKEFLYRELQKIPGLKPYRPSVNYLFVEIKDMNMDSGTLREKLARRGFLIRDCGNYPGLTSHFFRLAVRKREENTLLIKTMKDIFSGQGEIPIA